MAKSDMESKSKVRKIKNTKPKKLVKSKPVKTKKPTKAKNNTEPVLEEPNYDDLYVKLAELEEKIEKLSK
jgi:hypothetical protein